MDRLSGRDIALTGVPRSGTTLACKLLGEADNTVALFEPMDVGTACTSSPEDCVEHVQAFMRATRRQVLDTGTAPSKQVRGQVPDNLFGPRGASGERAALATPGTIPVSVPGPGFTLVVKHNAMFTAVLRSLAARIETFAIVRNPLAVLLSWSSVDLPVRDGRAPMGERLDPTLAQRLDREPDAMQRQLVLLDWFFAQYGAHLARDRVLTYEDMVETHGASLLARLGVIGPGTRVLNERNAGHATTREHVDHCLEALRSRDGAWRAWYPRESIESLHARIVGRTHA